MTTQQLITAFTQRSEKPFLIIGGHAVVAHGYPRTTMDLDLLVCTADREVWIRTLAELQYQPCHLHQNFAQFTSDGDSMDVDLMFVQEATFKPMFDASRPISFGSVSARMPSLEHLIALKLHVLKQGLEHRTIGDLDDVINLILTNRVDVRSEKWRSIFEKYGEPRIYEKVCHAIEQ